MAANSTLMPSPLSAHAGFYLLETATASSSSEVTLTTGIDSTYDRYLIVVTGLIPGTDSTHVQIEVSTDGGSTWDTSSNYDWAGDYNNNGVGSGAYGQSNFGYWRWTDGITAGASTGESLNGEITIHQPSNSTNYLVCHSTISSWTFSGAVGKAQQSMGWSQSTAVNGFRFYMSSGNIASGTFKLYGIK